MGHPQTTVGQMFQKSKPSTQPEPRGRVCAWSVRSRKIEGTPSPRPAPHPAATEARRRLRKTVGLPDWVLRKSTLAATKNVQKAQSERKHKGTSATERCPKVGSNHRALVRTASWLGVSGWVHRRQVPRQKALAMQRRS